jgi:hypothetical protein
MIKDHRHATYAPKGLPAFSAPDFGYQYIL